MTRTKSRTKDRNGNGNGAKTAVRLFPVVGIGASAGGLEAVSRLLKALRPDTGMAFVLIQHLDPEHNSLLPQILQKETRMPVTQAKDGAVLVPNHVYIIPPAVGMTVSLGKLKLLPRPTGVVARSVDDFLNSLAAERRNQAIAVILSGTASDGSEGIIAIKAEGGVVFAQDGSAGHGGMPENAVATGKVDFVMPPEKIARELSRIASHPVLGPEPERLLGDDKSLQEIFRRLREATGVDFSLYKSSTIRRRLLRRLLVHRRDTLADYVNILREQPDEAIALHDDLLIHVTSFFREPATLHVIREKVLPRVLKSLAADKPIRIWVPGCSTGEEAYTLGIVLLDYLSEHQDNRAVQIFATDISESALEKARAGIYPSSIADQVAPRLLGRYFKKVSQGYEIAQRVRDLVVFARQDLTREPPFANVDMISCCNVLIYLDKSAQNQIFPMFHYALRPSGALIMSHSESVGEFEDLFTAADRRCRVYLKNPSANLRFVGGRQLALPTPPSRRKGAAPAIPDGGDADVQRVAERLLLARFAPAGVIVDDELNILSFRGAVNRYLQPGTGTASLDLLRMLPAHSAGALRAVIAKARKSDLAELAPGVELGLEGEEGAVNVEVIPFRLPLSGSRYFIVLFSDPSGGAGARKPAARSGPVRASVSDQAPLRRLKAELEAARGYMQSLVEDHASATEEIKTANEEVISSNEELQSTNEELEIAKEELQAANEELSTVNDELQSRNTDLNRLNNDLTNLISSVHLPIVMVSSDLRIRRFSPMAERIMNLIPGDIGRPIGDIKPKIPLPNIEEIIHEVIETVNPKDLDVRDADGHSYSVRVRPYKTADNRIEGAVLLFVDNDPIRRGLSGVDEASAFEAALELADEPLTVLDAQMHVKAGSRGMYQAFGLTSSQLGKSLFEIESGRWNVPELRLALESLAAGGKPFASLAASVGGRRLKFSARRIAPKSGGKSHILLAIKLSP